MNIKVLVIDDDKAITELMGLLLQTQGFEVITTNSSIEGVQLAAEQNPQIVLLDLMMPELDGWQVCTAIRKFSNMPILVLSAVNDPAMVASALDVGADGFLSKPVPTSVLVAHIKKITNKQAGVSFANAPAQSTSATLPRNSQSILA